MSERPRILQAALERSLGEFPVAALIGLRQAGKTTLALRAGGGRSYVTLDDLGALAAAREDPEGFVEALPRPATIDEVQRVPELLLAIKRRVDRDRRPGRFLLTGSARLELKRGVQETLAGRAALLRLRPMTWAEAAGTAGWNPIDLLFGCRSAAEAARRLGRGAAFDGERVVAGGLPPALLGRWGATRGRWFEQYRSAYVERDVAPLVRIEEVAAFVRFVSFVASRTAQTTNTAALAHQAGVSADTGARWCGVLEATFLTDRLAPYGRNIGRRFVKSPKLHFGDAGLAAYLLGARGWREALRLNVSGPLLETLVAQHLLAFGEACARPVGLFHYRTHAGAEVDFVLERGPRLVPVEVKSSATVKSSEVRGMVSFLNEHEGAAPFGVVLTCGREAHPVARRVVALPLSLVLGGPQS